MLRIPKLSLLSVRSCIAKDKLKGKSITRKISRLHLHWINSEKDFHDVNTVKHYHDDLSNKRNLFLNAFSKKERPRDPKATTLHLEIEFALETCSSIVSLPFSAFLRPSPMKYFLEIRCHLYQGTRSLRKLARLWSATDRKSSSTLRNRRSNRTNPLYLNTHRCHDKLLFIFY